MYRLKHLGIVRMNQDPVTTVMEHGMFSMELLHELRLEAAG